MRSSEGRAERLASQGCQRRLSRRVVTAACAMLLPGLLLIAGGATADAPVIGWGANDSGQTDISPWVDGSPSGHATSLALNDYSCAIQSETGAVVCWGGTNDTGEEPPVPPSVNGAEGTAIAVVTGADHACAIQSGTGAVVCWGVDAYGYGTLTPPASVDGTEGTASAISAGLGQHTCAIQGESGPGAVVCWGSISAAPPPSVNGAQGTASAISAGGGFSCAVRSDTGAVVCWGGVNNNNELVPPDAVNGTSGSKASAID